MRDCWEENATFGNFFVSVSMKYHEMSTNGVTGKTAAVTVTPSGLLEELWAVTEHVVRP